MSDYDADVIVVGAGSLGALAALEIARAGRSVIILEAGPDLPNWKALLNFRSSPRKANFNAPFGDLPHAPNSYSPGYLDNDLEVETIPGNLRVKGGTSRHWAGIAWRFLPEEMKMRSTFGVGRDWPLDYDELEPFYTQAEYEVGVNGLDGDDQSGRGGGEYPPRSKPYPLPPEAKPYPLQRFQMRTAPLGYRLQHAPSTRHSQPWKGRAACIGSNNCNPVCPVGARHSGVHDCEAAVAAGAQIRTDAVVDRLAVDGSGRITEVSYQSPEGERTTLSARAFVLAAHGFETPKLLLMNDLANRSGMVGRNFMVHPTLFMDMLADEPVWLGRGQYLHGAILQRRMENSRDRMAGGFYQFMNHSMGPTMAGRVIQEGGRIGAALDAEFRERAARYFTVHQLLEDLPRPENAITLNPSYRDSLGTPGIRVRYRLDSYTRAALPRAVDDYSNWLEAMGGVRLEAPGRKWYNQHHIMGTTIMGDDPADSVVDADLRCHDHSNLFLVTTGVFPSSSCVNPTLTGMALALRAGRTVAREI